MRDRAWIKVTGLLFTLAWCGCAARPPALPPQAQEASEPVASRPGLVNSNSAELAQLWSERQNQASDFPIGPGDLLEVSAPGIDELQDRTVRVDGNGHIYLPIIGDLQVGGKTEKEIRVAVNRGLEKVLYHPQADIFVKKYRSHWVAVMGAVGQPGMYVLDGPQDTIRQLIERAGGLTDKAGSRILLTPGGANEEDPEEGELSSAILPVSAKLAGPDPDRTGGKMDPEHGLLAASQMPGNSTTVVIDLRREGGNSRYLNIPLRPGDTISVPAAGSVTVIGWVYHPETIPITPGLTVLGAVSAAGGPLFAADMDTVKIIRQQSGGRSVIFSVDLNKAEHHEADSTPVCANDVIDVSYSAARLPGYAVYYAMRGIFGWAPAAAVVSGVP